MIRLKLWRLQRGMTQTQAARATGIGGSAYAMLESGRLRPTYQQLSRLRELFGSLTDSLFESVREQVGP
jgi:transcriptional regulator with XRE-family HTH domain